MTNKKSIKKETRTEKIKRYMRLTKKDLAIMLADSMYCFDQIRESIKK